MNKIFTLTLLSFLICTAASAQLVISEIMYNPPESGQDSLEYIEITHAGGADVNLEGYAMGLGVIYTFPAITLSAGDAIVLSKDSSALMNTLGVMSRQWTDGALSNGGETISLVDADSVVLDLVDFGSASPWPGFSEGAAGAGASIELCDLSSDNSLPDSWAAASNGTGVSINDRELLGTPGMANTANCDVVVLYPARPIGEVTTVDDDGVADSLNVTCMVEGIVYGINLRPNGLSFTVIDDANDGINVFELSDNFGYTVTEGDRIQVDGQVDQFRGLIQMRPAEIRLLSSGNTLASPTVLAAEDELSEDTESQYVEISGVRMIDPSQWAGDGSGFNVVFTNGLNEYAIRIDNDTEMSNMPAPGDENTIFNIRGLGGQFAGSTPPYEGGYQLFPMTNNDISVILSQRDIELSQFATWMQMSGAQFAVTADRIIDAIAVYSVTGSQVQQSRDAAYTHHIDLSAHGAGMYIVELRSGDTREIRKVIAQ